MNRLAPLWLLLVSCAALAGEPATPPEVIQFPADSIQWKPGPPTLPAGAEIAVLEGDPKGEGLFTMRVKLPAGAKLPPHWHPRPERVTVISGSIGLAFGDVFDQTKLKIFRAGSYYVTPPEVHHYAAAPEEVVVQITTIGPWQLHAVASRK